MSQAKVYNQEGSVVKTVDLDPRIFDVAVKSEVVKRAVVAQQSNSRQVLAHTKTRSEVRGGGKKPWRQKGTGRARHGSIRSPIWVGGGITFGPRNTRNFSVRINAKERQKALFMSLSAKAAAEKILLLDTVTLESPKTKMFAGILKKLPGNGKSILFVQSAKDATLTKSARNIPKVSTIAADSLNIVDVLKHEYMVMPIDGLKVISNTFRKASA